MKIEVVCALPDRQRVVTLELPEGATAREAVCRADLAADFPEIDPAHCPIGIWGKPVPDDRPLRDGDRVEIYRPLLNDPREARRRAAARGTVIGRKPPR